MKIANQLPLQRLIGKIDNDFNISDSDWIPRVAAWTIDALAQMNILPSVKKRRELEVYDRIAHFPYKINAKDIKVFDECNREIPFLNKHISCDCTSTKKYNSQEIAVIDTSNKTGVNFMNVVPVIEPGFNRNFVLQGDSIELNFDTDKIYVESYEVATYFDDYYQCDVPYIYDDGLLLEALAWYCLFKHLSRGNKHQVYDLKTNNAVLNPYMQWNVLRLKAANSVRHKLYNDSGWRNFFYNSTFAPRG